MNVFTKQMDLDICIKKIIEFFYSDSFGGSAKQVRPAPACERNDLKRHRP
jgi:hypothetical protein